MRLPAMSCLSLHPPPPLRGMDPPLGMKDMHPLPVEPPPRKRYRGPDHWQKEGGYYEWSAVVYVLSKCSEFHAEIFFTSAPPPCGAPAIPLFAGVGLQNCMKLKRPLMKQQLL